MSENNTDRIAELERQIEELNARMPKHSPSVSMLVELDELDAALEQARAEAAQEAGPPRGETAQTPLTDRN